MAHTSSYIKTCGREEVVAMYKQFRKVSPRTVWRETYFQHYSLAPKIRNKNHGEAKRQNTYKKQVEKLVKIKLMSKAKEN